MERSLSKKEINDPYILIHIYSYTCADLCNYRSLIFLLNVWTNIRPKCQDELLEMLYRGGVYPPVMKKSYVKYPNAITNIPEYAFYYAHCVIHSRFPAGEKAILCDIHLCHMYILNVIRSIYWKEGMDLLKKNSYSKYKDVLIKFAGKGVMVRKNNGSPRNRTRRLLLRPFD